MTKNKYTSSTFEDLIHNQDFIDFVRNSSETDWEKFLSEYSNNRENFVSAKEIIRTFHVYQGELDNIRKNELRDFINSYQQRKNPNKSYLGIRTLFRVAASLALILSLGGAIYYFLDESKLRYEFSEFEMFEETENSMVILSTGETVELKNEESTIAVLDKKETILVDNDTIVKTTTAEETIKNDKNRLTEVIVPFGKKTELILNDGTKVWLNAGSRFAFPKDFDDKHRTVFLDGEGYFEVATNEYKPFIVSSNNLNIEVLGTKFNVSSYSDDDFSETVLVEGSVKVWGRNKLVNEKVILNPNEAANYKINQKEMVLHKVDNPGKYISWINGWYEFDNVVLEKVLIKLERYYNIHINYSPEIVDHALPISGKLDLKDSIDDVMSFLTEVAEVQYKVKDDKILITR